MAKIHLVVPDAALRGAIAEALVPTVSDLAETADGASALKDPETVAIILDEDAADKKALKTLKENSASNCRIYILGEADAAWRELPTVELFPKPLRLGHLLTRLQLHLRANSKTRKDAPALGPWRLELHNRQIVRAEDGAVVRLTEKETALLDYLAQSDEPVGREELLAAIWGHDGRIDTHTLETHVYQLRRKLDPDGEGVNLLLNEQGAYRLKALS